MDSSESLSHSRWECKYRVVFIPKCRRKALFAELRRELGEVFRRLAEQKESRVLEGHLMPDHVHMLLSSAFSSLVWSIGGPMGSGRGCACSSEEKRASPAESIVTWRGLSMNRRDRIRGFSCSAVLWKAAAMWSPRR